MMKYFLGLSVFIITTVLYTAQGQACTDDSFNYNRLDITPSEEAELKRVNVYRFPTYNFKKENDNISFNDDRVADNRRPYKDNQNIEPQSVRLTPKPKFVNSKPVTFFAWQLFQSANNGNVANYVLSPLSPQLLLSHLVTVAAGTTKNEIKRAIRYDDPNKLGDLVESMLQSTSNRELKIASAFFVSKDMKINNHFVEDSVDRNVDVVVTQFANQDAAKGMVNKWVSEKTNQKITNVQLAITPDTRVLMTSVVYFSAKWLYTFHSANNEIFHSKNSHKSVKMMNIKKKFNYGNINRLAEWVSIPYDSAESMVILLPDENVGLDKLIQNMSEDVFLNITENIYKEETQANVDLTMPTFRISSLVSLVEPFQKMGMNTLFNSDSDIPNLATNERVQLSNAQQQSILDVNESGTVAVSLTTFSVVALSFSAPIPTVKLTINRPFLCMIVDRDTNIPLFIAKVSNPQ